jgi:iron only hydrogenase large subunit-like protein
MAFSGALQLAGLDHITPSQACTKPLKITKTKPTDTTTATNSKVTVTLDDHGVYTEHTSNGDSVVLQAAKISLNDCLACSGCITSAESVLITQQSKDEFYNQLGTGKTIIVSIAPQVRASLAAHYHMTQRDALGRLMTFFKTLGVAYVFDTTFTRDFALIEGALEFVERYRTANGSCSNNHSLPLLTSACPGMWVSSAARCQSLPIKPLIRVLFCVNATT